MIAQLEEKDMQFVAIYKRQGMNDMRVMPHSNASFILDAGMLTTGFPVIQVRGGKNSRIKLTYSEALYVDGRKTPYHVPDKGDVEGIFDVVISSGKVTYYEPILWRTFRYVKVDIETFDEELFIEDIHYRFISYPLKEVATYQSSDPLHKKMWDMSWWTVRLCTHETFEDCPYYEQMQYAGDSQVVSLVAGYVSGDWSLTRQAVLHFDWSRDYEGITKSRYPSVVPQKIPSWSILWVVMVSDYYLHTADKETTERCLDGINATLHWLEKYLNNSYLLEKLPYWKVVDWVKEWKHPNGCPPGAEGGVTALISLQYAYALMKAAELFREFGREREADHFMNIRDKITEEVRRSCWSDEHKLYRDRPGYDEFSELGNAWAILSEAATPEQAKAIASQIGVNPILAKSTLYGRFYVFRALSKADSYDDVAPRLFTMWHSMMKTDLTTWPEDPYFARSYCHAWSSTPIYEFLSEILGIKPLKPGFKEVLIKPHILNLTGAEGSVPTMYGVIHVRWEIVDGEFTISVKLPDGVKGKIVLPNGQVHFCLSSL
ncbi:alpha-L-rhamnosidase [Caldanaerobius fijiensis DSM 17918]|uniref:Alpha-L-rhamnosidase n=2 Tax=Caldanaerobius TaxID=862261 RepID=A0A1M4ZYW3_9THEO|nr:alpha-L-rhamnosidase [Caldanaerobius fijiensis DSM 17918]